MAGHNLQDERPRTEDIEFDRSLRFEQMVLSEAVVRGLSRNSFVIPSPNQVRAIPLVELGLDMELAVAYFVIVFWRFIIFFLLRQICWCRPNQERVRRWSFRC